jgi:hypothetical protein
MRVYFKIFYIFLLFVSCNYSDERNKFDVALDIEKQSNDLMDNLFNDDFVFPEKYKIINLEGDTIMLGSLLDSSKIVIRLNERFCESCITEQINLINSAIKFPQDKIIGLASYNNIRKFRIFVKKNNINFPVYFISHFDGEQIFSINDSFELPYYFHLDKTLSSKFIFHPNLNHLKSTVDYLIKSSEIINEKKEKKPININNRSLFVDNVIYNKASNIEILYTNNTLENLVIDSIKVSCECLNIISFDKLLKPHMTGNLQLRFVPSANLGFDQKEITFYIKNKGDYQYVLKSYIVN